MLTLCSFFERVCRKQVLAFLANRGFTASDVAASVLERRFDATFAAYSLQKSVQSRTETLASSLPPSSSTPVNSNPSTAPRPVVAQTSTKTASSASVDAADDPSLFFHSTFGKPSVFFDHQFGMASTPSLSVATILDPSLDNCSDVSPMVSDKVLSLLSAPSAPGGRAVLAPSPAFPALPPRVGFGCPRALPVRVTLIVAKQVPQPRACRLKMRACSSLINWRFHFGFSHPHICVVLSLHVPRSSLSAPRPMHRPSRLRGHRCHVLGSRMPISIAIAKSTRKKTGCGGNNRPCAPCCNYRGFLRSTFQISTAY
jgi:hypothetical protein